jgi:hypothetical protein
MEAWVADFGLAKADDQQNLTATGDILGTLRYMRRRPRRWSSRRGQSHPEPVVILPIVPGSRSTHQGLQASPLAEDWDRPPAGRADLVPGAEA